MRVLTKRAKFLTREMRILTEEAKFLTREQRILTPETRILTWEERILTGQQRLLTRAADRAVRRAPVGSTRNSALVFAACNTKRWIAAGTLIG
jgi:hypothetical protein